MWLSPVERCVRVAEVPGSNPGTPIDGSEGTPEIRACRLPHNLTPHDLRCPDPGNGAYSDARTLMGSGIVVWSAGRMVMHSPRKRAPERAWGFESLALRYSPPDRPVWGACSWLVIRLVRPGPSTRRTPMRRAPPATESGASPPTSNPREWSAVSLHFRVPVPI